MLKAVAVSLFMTISLLSASVLAADMPEGAREVGERAKAVPIGSSAFSPTLTNPQCTIKVAAPFANFDLIEFHVKTQGYVRYCAVKQPNGKILADIIFQVTNAKNADALYVCSKQVWLAADGTVLKTSLKDANAYAGYNNVFHDITYMTEVEFKSVAKWAWDFTCTGE